MKFFIIACEPSGDLHGSLLVEELKKMIPVAEFLGLGGPQMQGAGVSVLEDMTRLSALGLSDVLRQYFRYRSIFFRALQAVQDFKPDALVLIDSPAFNLRFAQKISAMKYGGPVFYYIAPQIWAWGGRCIHTIKKTVSKMLVILPFEKEIYEKAGVPVEFVGHPLLDETHPSAPRPELRRRFGMEENETAIGLLPGSRKSEVERILPDLLKTAALLKKSLPSCRFFLSRSSNVPASVYESILQKAGCVFNVMSSPRKRGSIKSTLVSATIHGGRVRGNDKQVLTDIKIEECALDFQDLVSALDFAFVTSGTATLQTALLGTPFFLVYRASRLTYELGKRLVRVSYLGLVNLLAGKRVVPEFIQQDMHPETMAHEAKVFLANKELYGKMKEAFEEIKKKLGAGGASQRAAEVIAKSQKMGQVPLPA